MTFMSGSKSRSKVLESVYYISITKAQVLTKTATSLQISKISYKLKYKKIENTVYRNVKSDSES